MLKKILALVLCSVALGAAASPTAPLPGKEYVVLNERQPAEAGHKVEVIEFFAYYCPHCYALEPSLAAWAKKQGDNIVFKRIHVGRGPAVLPQQKLFFALEALGLVEQYHAKVFNAMHVEHNPLRSDEAVIAWAAQNGIDKVRFTDAYNSMGVNARVRRTTTMMGDYRVDYWPMLFVDGKYMTSPYEASKGTAAALSEDQQQANALQVLDFLVAKAKAEKK